MGRGARFLAWLCLCLLPLAALAQEPTDAQIAAQSDSGWLAGLIESNLSSVGRTVIIEGFEGALSSTATIRTLTIADNDGVWLRADDLRLNWNRAALLRGRIEIRELTAGHINLLRRPVAEAAPVSPEASPFSLPELPVSVNVGQIRADRITLGADFLGTEIALNVTGSVELVGGTGHADVTASRLDGADGNFALRGSYSNATRVLSVDLTLDEAEGGIVSTLLGLPGDPSVKVELAGTGPIDDYSATLLVATDGVTRITGEAGLVTVPDPDGGAPGQDFRLNVRGDVTTLIAPQYHEFFGPMVSLTVQGSRGGDGTLLLPVFNLAADSITLTGAAAFSADGWPLRLNLTGELAAKDGRPVVLPGTGPGTTVQSMTLDVSYDVDAGNAWRGDFLLTDLHTPGVRVPSLALTGGGEIVPGSDTAPGRFSVAVAYQAAGLMLDDPALALAMGDRIGGEIALSRQGDDPFRISRFTLTGPGIGIQAEGTIAGPGAGFLTQTSVTLRAADASRFGPLTGLDLGGSADVVIVSSIQPLDRMFDVILTGTARDLSFGIPALDPLLRGESLLNLSAVRDTAGARINGLSIVTPAFRADGSANLTSGASDAVFDMTITDVGVSLPGLTGPGRLRGTANRAEDGRLTLDVNATLPGSTAAISASVGSPESGGLVVGSVLADVADLAPFGPLFGLPLSGRIEAIVSGQGQPDGSLFDVTAFGRTADVTLGIPQVDALLTGVGQIDGRVIRTGPQDLRVEGFKVATPAITATGTVALTNGAGEADLDIALTDIGPLVPGLSGPAQVTGTASRDGTGIITLNLGGVAPGAVLRVAGTVAPPEQGNVFDGRISVDVADIGPFAAVAGQPMTGGVSLVATGTARPDLSQIDMAVAGETRNLQTGVAQIDPLLTGTGTIAAQVTRSDTAMIAVKDLRIEAPAFSLTGGFDLGGGAGQATLDLRIADIAPVAPGFSGPARLSGSAFRETGGTYDIDLSLTGPGTAATVAATIAGPDRGYFTEVEVTGRVDNLAAWSGLAGRRLGGAVNGRVAGTVTPGANAFDLTVAAQTTNIDPGVALVATVLRGTGTVDGRVRLGTDERLRIDGLEVRYPNLTLRGDISGGRDSGQARLDARLADIGIIAPQFSGPATLAGTATLNAAGIWQLQMNATGAAGTQAAVQGSVAGTVATGLRLDVTARGQAPLGLANAFIEPNRIDGMATFDMAVKGPPALTSVNGTVRVDGARVALPALRIAMPGVAGTIAITGGRASIDMRGGVEGGGNLTVAGTVGLSGGLPADLRITATEVSLRDATLYQTTATGAVTVTGPLAGGALIAGSIDLGPTELQIPSSSVGVLGDLPVVFHIEPSVPVVQTLARANLTAEGTAIGGASSGPAAIFGLDLTVRAPARVFIRGRGLDAELGGEIGISGTTAQIITRGQFDLIRGRIVVLTRRFELTEGSATLQGDFVPEIKLVSTTKARTGTTVIITVEGPATEPTVTFSSNPPLPQDEVVAQLFLGVDLASVTPLQAIELASAVATLSGKGGTGVIEQLRTGAGLDDLDITTDDNGNAAVRVGRYLTDNLYTDVTVGSRESEVNLNFDVTDDLTLQGSVTSDGETVLGIYFERDY